MPDPDPAPVRSSVLDGLRGLAILLVVLSHIWVVYPFTRLSDIAPLDGWFRAGSVAVSMLLVLSGFFLTRTLLSSYDSNGSSGIFGPLLRRTVRISTQVYLAVLAVLFVAGIDSTDSASDTTNSRSAAAIATYTWNWYARDHALEARTDLGHLWYLSVELQVFLVLTVVIALWGRHRHGLTIGVVALILATTWWRWHVFETEGWFSASLRTSTRADAALYGILCGLVWDRVQRWRHEAPAMAGASALILIAVVFSCSRLGIDAYFKVQGMVVALTTVIFVLAASMGGADDGPTAKLFGSRPLRTLGTVSLTLYVWHLPVYWFMSRHTTTWGHASRALATLALLSALVFALHRFVDEPVRKRTSQLWRARPATPVETP